MTDTAPLKAMIARYLDEAMVEKIAQEYAKGRLLLVATTNLDQGRPVIWNIGAIAESKQVTYRIFLENWNTELQRWLSPFLEKLGHKARRQIYSLYGFTDANHACSAGAAVPSPAASRAAAPPAKTFYSTRFCRRA